MLFITLEDATLCPRYIAGYIKGVKVGPSPDWLKQGVESIGQRSINNVVDATNVVMFNIGQPLHAFDAGKLTQKDGKFHIVVRKAAKAKK
jgi:phenylalanyl-tRNA synthetase beta chain